MKRLNKIKNSLVVRSTVLVASTIALATGFFAPTTLGQTIAITIAVDLTLSSSNNEVMFFWHLINEQETRQTWLSLVS